MRRNVTRSIIILIILQAVVSCNLFGPRPVYETISAGVSVSPGGPLAAIVGAPDPSNIDQVTLTISGEDKFGVYQDPLATDLLTLTAGVWQVIVDDLPIGPPLTFAVSALDAGGLEIYSGSATRVLGGAGETVSIVLYPVDDGTPVFFPVIQQITRPAEILHDSDVIVSVDVTGTANEELDLEFTSSGGTFVPSPAVVALPSSGAGSLDATYTAPDTVGSYTQTIRATNEQGNSVSRDFVTVIVYEIGSADVVISISPAVIALAASRSGNDLTYTATVTDDAPLNEIVYEWSFAQSAGTAGAGFGDPATNPGVLSGYDETVSGTVELTVTDADELSTTVSFELPAGQFPDTVVTDTPAAGSGSVVFGDVFELPGLPSQFNDVAVDATGERIAVGFRTYPTGHGAAMIVKYGPDGTELWNRLYYASPNASVFNAVDVDAAGNIYVAGYQVDDLPYTYETGVVVAGTSQLRNAVLVKYDTNGTALWARTTTGGLNESEFTDVSVDPAGVSVAGIQRGNGTVMFATHASVTSNDPTSDRALLVRFSTTGAPQWARTVSPGLVSAYSIYRGVVTDDAGSSYVAGSVAGSGIVHDFGGAVTLTGIRNGGNLVLARYDPSGTPQWAFGATGGSGASNANGFSIAQNSAGNLILGGEQSAGGAIGLGNGVASTVTGSGGVRRLLVAVDPNGLAQWARTVAGADGSTAEFQDLAVLSDDSIVGVGSYYEPGTRFSTVHLFDPAGADIWTRSVTESPPGTGASQFVGVDRSTADQIVVVGHQYRNIPYDYGDGVVLSGPFTYNNPVILEYAP